MRAPREIGWMAAIVIVAAGAVALEVQLYRTNQELEQARTQLVETRTNVSSLEERFSTQRNSLDTVRADVDATREQVTRAREAVTETKASLSDTLAAESRARSENEHASRKEMETVAADVRQRLRSVQGMAGNTAMMTMANAKAIGALRDKVAVDPKALKQGLLGPSVKVENARAVGGGTCIWSADDGSGVRHTYILTAHHVIAGAITGEGAEEKRSTVTVTRYPQDGTAPIASQAEIVSYDSKRDLALLKLRGKSRESAVAALSTREELAKVAVFDRVTAVGCPLGHAPLPTEGEIVSLDKKVAGEKFWMMSAPTIFGNSGGGIFAAGSPRLVGVSAMICVYDTIVSMPVPHLGVLVPLSSVYDWFDSQGYQFLYDRRFTRDECEQGRAVIRALAPSVVDASWEGK